MNFIADLTWSRMKRQKQRLAFVLLAIAASSCLIVWTIGGFQALFIDATNEEADYLGRYDLRIAAKESENADARRGAGGGFSGPFERPTKPTKNKSPKSASATERGDEKRGEKRGGGQGNGTPGGRGAGVEFPADLIAALRADPAVVVCDETAPVRAFVYSPGTERSILEDADEFDEGNKPTLKRSLELSGSESTPAPNGIDPDLHRRAFAAYRATMGTPTGLGSTFLSTNAAETPFELVDGKWLQGADSTAQEAVLTERGAAKMNAKPGDSLLLIGKTTESQLKIVGIVADPNSNEFYVTTALANEISDAPTTTNALFLKLRGDVDEFRARWNARIDAAFPTAPGVETLTEPEITARKAAEFKRSQSFQYQAASGTLLAALAAIFIVFTALNTGVCEQKRLIAFYRTAGLTRAQVGASILWEAVLLAIPGWLAGLATGWLLIFVCSGKTTGLNWKTVGFSFVCAGVGAVLAALYPMFKSARIKPLDAIGSPEKTFLSPKKRRRQTIRFVLFALFGALCIGADVYFVQVLPMETAKKAALHSGVGVLLLAFGVVCCVPLSIRLAEAVLLPILATIFRFDARTLRSELSGNASRVVAVSVALSVGGGLFVSMQIWGYSMLDPFLPNRSNMPDVFAAFLPNGLRPEIVERVKSLPEIKKNRFLPIAVEQAAFATASIRPKNGDADDPKKSPFANVVFFGANVDRAFAGRDALVGMRFRQGDPQKAFVAMKTGRGVVVTDSLSVDYGLNLGDVLKVVHPRDASKILAYPIVGVVYFPGWQWISKTGGVRRNFGRSGGLVFADEKTIIADYQIERPAYFWFDVDGSRTYLETEAACDLLARENLTLDQAEQAGSAVEKAGTPGKNAAKIGAQTAYVKLSTRDSLTASISRRADSVIWGLSKTPLTTLIVASIAVVGAISNSVRARRWQFGAMRAIGWTRSAVVRSILVEAALIGTVASATSFCFGFLAAQGALKLGRSMFGTVDPPLILPIEGLFVGFGLTLTLCLAAALYPAIQTAREEPLQLLRGARTPE